MIGRIFLHVVAEQLAGNIAWRARIQLMLPRSVLISPLCAMIAIRMRALPAREGVRRKARMDQRQRRFHRRVRQVGIILIDLLRSVSMPL